MTQGQLLLHSFSTHHIHQHTLHEHYALCAIFRQKLNPWLFKIGLSPMIPRLQSPHFKNEKIFELRESDLQCLHCKLNCTACADVTDGFRAWNAEETSRKGFSTFLLVRILNKQAMDKVLSTSLSLFELKYWGIAQTSIIKVNLETRTNLAWCCCCCNAMRVFLDLLRATSSLFLCPGGGWRTFCSFFTIRKA